MSCPETDEERLARAEAAILNSIEDGISSISTDGLQSTYASSRDRLAALEEIRQNQLARQGTLGFSLIKLVPPGCG